MKEAVKKSAGSSGIMTINKNIAADVEKLVQKYVNDAMQQGVDLDTLGPEQLKMIVQLNKPKRRDKERIRERKHTKKQKSWPLQFGPLPSWQNQI